MAVKYYAVAVGKKPGIYTKWDECKAMVHGFPGAVYKSFKTLEEAETFLESAPARGGETHAKGAAQQKATPGAAQQKSGTAGDGKAETRGAESAGETEDLPENIKEQMQQQMAEDDGKMYWVDNAEVPEWNFDKITDETSFYLDSDGHLVICFNEGDVAPMYMGCVQFVIPDEVVADIRK